MGSVHTLCRLLWLHNYRKPTRFHCFIVLRRSLKPREGVLLVQDHTAMVEIWISRFPVTVTTMKRSKPFPGTTNSHCGALSWVPKNWCFCTVVLEKTLESPLDCKEIQPVHSKGDQSWVFFGRNDAKAESYTLATSHEELTHWKRLWCWEGSGAGGEGDEGGWDGWMASPTQWTWVWVNSGSWWPGQGGLVCCDSWGRKDWATELNWWCFLLGPNWGVGELQVQLVF